MLFNLMCLLLIFLEFFIPVTIELLNFLPVCFLNLWLLLVVFYCKRIPDSFWYFSSDVDNFLLHNFSFHISTLFLIIFLLNVEGLKIILNVIFIILLVSWAVLILRTHTIHIEKFIFINNWYIALLIQFYNIDYQLFAWDLLPKQKFFSTKLIFSSGFRQTLFQEF